MKVSNLSRIRSGLGIPGVAAGCLWLSACASSSIGNAPPAVVDECRREVAELTDRDVPPLDATLPEERGTDLDTIDDARVARAELEGSGLAAWPEDALLYRCFSSRGVVLTEAQATVLAEWQSRTDMPETR